MAVAPERTRAADLRGHADSASDPDRARRSPTSCARRATSCTINFGPNHPSTHGVLRLIVDLYGEDVVGLEAVVGYLHTGFEKTMEQKTWWKAITYPERIDYLSFQNNELVFVLAIEKLLGLEIPPKATWMRTLPLRAEPDPLAPDLARHGGARAGRDLDVLVLLPRARADHRPLRDGLRRAHAHALLPGRRPRRGHPARLLPRGAPVRRRGCRRRSTSTRRSSTGTRSGSSGRSGSGSSRADDAIALGQSGPVLRASGVDWDLRKVEPYLAYAECDFRVPVYQEGDVYARYRVHMEEMRESMQIIDQCLDRLEGMEGEPWIADDRKVVLPPREELHTSMESLIHHFKIVTEGYRVPEGEVYVDRRVAARRARLLRRLRRRARSRGASSSARRRSSRSRRPRPA